MARERLLLRALPAVSPVIETGRPRAVRPRWIELAAGPRKGRRSAEVAGGLVVVGGEAIEPDCRHIRRPADAKPVAEWTLGNSRRRRADVAPLLCGTPQPLQALVGGQLFGYQTHRATRHMPIPRTA